MSPVAASEKRILPPTLPTLDDFFEQVQTSNPFEANRIGQAGLAEMDALAVHQKAFAQLHELAGIVGQQSLALGVLLWGEAGIGKSHFLARLARWAGTDHQQAVCIYLANLQAAPDRLPHSLLRCVISILTRGRTRQFRGTPLYALACAALRRALDAVRSDVSWAQAEAAHQRLIDDLCARGPGQAAFTDRQVHAVLFRFFRSAYLAAYERHDDGAAPLAVRWLAGDPLEREEARALGLPAGEMEPADEQRLRNVLVALAQAASYRQTPLLLCCDQVDCLEPAQFGALARFLHAVLDSAGNLLVITSGLRSTLEEWLKTGVVQESSWQRLSQHDIMLQRVSVQEASQIVQARLQAFQEPFVTLTPVKQCIQQDYLFPLGRAWEEEFLAGKTDVRPRDVINWARMGWRRQQALLREQGGSTWLAGWSKQGRGPGPGDGQPVPELHTAIDNVVEQRLQEYREQRRRQPEVLPPDADHLVELLRALLGSCLHRPEWPALLEVERVVPKGRQQPYDLMIRHLANGTACRMGVRCLVVSDRKSMAAHLRHIAEDERPPERVVLVTEERCPLEPGAAGVRRLDEICQQHGERFLQVQLSFDEYAELDAMQALLRLARSGDLEIESSGGWTRPVSEEELLTSYHRQQRFRTHRLLNQLLEAAVLSVPAPNTEK
jgi:hypothetical protein